MKKRIACLLAGLLLFTTTACSAAQPQQAKAPLRVVSTIFPPYDWVRQIAGSRADAMQLTLLLDNGVDLHSYQPTADDMIKISTCDVFIYVGGESDGWVADALKEAQNPNLIAVNLLEALGDSAKEEVLVEGMQDEHEEGEEAQHAEEAPEYDEHVWLSLKNAQTLTAHLATVLAQANAQNAAEYAANAKAYTEKLAALDAQYAQAIGSAPQKTLVFGDRFPFRYLADDYGLAYYAAFAGCSAETEASFATVTFLADKMDELNLQSIMVLEGAQHKIAQTIVQNTKNKNQAVLTLDSMQSVTGENVVAGASYLGIMQNNLSVLQQALQ